MALITKYVDSATIHIKSYAGSGHMAIGNPDSWVYQSVGIPKVTFDPVTVGAPYQKTKAY